MASGYEKTESAATLAAIAAVKERLNGEIEQRVKHIKLHADAVKALRKQLKLISRKEKVQLAAIRLKG